MRCVFQTLVSVHHCSACGVKMGQEKGWNYYVAARVRWPGEHPYTGEYMEVIHGDDRDQVVSDVYLCMSCINGSRESSGQEPIKVIEAYDPDGRIVQARVY